MVLYPFGDFVTTLKDGISKALRVSGETTIVNSEENPVYSEIRNNTNILVSKTEPITLEAGQQINVLGVAKKLYHGEIRGTFKRDSGGVDMSVLEVLVSFQGVSGGQSYVEKTNVIFDKDAITYGKIKAVESPTNIVNGITIKNNSSSVITLSRLYFIDAPSSTTGSLSTIKDGKNNNILRVTEAAPAGYDNEKGVIKTINKTEIISSQYKSGRVINNQTSIQFEVFSPLNSISEILSLGFYAPKIEGAVGGHQAVQIFIKTESSNLLLLSVKVPFDKGIDIANGINKVEGAEVSPADSVTQLLSIKGMKISDTVPLVVLYSNLTGHDQTKDVILDVIKEVS